MTHRPYESNPAADRNAPLHYQPPPPAPACCPFPRAGLPLVPLIQGLAGSKNELRVTWLKNDTTATSYKISGALRQKWMAAAC